MKTIQILKIEVMFIETPNTFLDFGGSALG